MSRVSSSRRFARTKQTKTLSSRVRVRSEVLSALPFSRASMPRSIRQSGDFSFFSFRISWKEILGVLKRM